MALSTTIEDQLRALRDLPQADFDRLVELLAVGHLFHDESEILGRAVEVGVDSDLGRESIAVAAGFAGASIRRNDYPAREFAQGFLARVDIDFDADERELVATRLDALMHSRAIDLYSHARRAWRDQVPGFISASIASELRQVFVTGDVVPSAEVLLQRLQLRVSDDIDEDEQRTIEIVVDINDLQELSKTINEAIDRFRAIADAEKASGRPVWGQAGTSSPGIAAES